MRCTAVRLHRGARGNISEALKLGWEAEVDAGETKRRRKHRKSLKGTPVPLRATQKSRKKK